MSVQLAALKNRTKQETVNVNTDNRVNWYERVPGRSQGKNLALLAQENMLLKRMTAWLDYFFYCRC